MKIIEKIRLLLHIIRWRLTWGRRNLDYRPPGVDNPKFISARDAARLIPDGVNVLSCGIAGNARCSVFFWALREAFLRRGHPRGLTWMNVGAQGSRGRVPGTVEELDPPGLLRRYLAGHLETAKSLLRLADAGMLDLHTLPQGIIALLLEAQGQGETHLHSHVGVGTFLDPRVGAGSQVTPRASDQFVNAEKAVLSYTMPRVDVAMFSAPYADTEGNIYFHHAACLSENVPAARAARANGGLVLATVSRLIPKDEPRISLRAGEVDYIVVHPYNEQTASIRQYRYWPMFTPDRTTDEKQAMARLRFINTVLKITPVRDEAGQAMARLAASVFAEQVPKGAMVNIGVGYPEEVARHLVEQGLGRDLVFTTEAGAYGGLPVPGIFFGAAIRPQRLISSTQMFRYYQEWLGAAVLGFLQVDSDGNVNASKRGPRMLDFVGPGGFPDIVDGAHTILFVGSWMANARFGLHGGRLAIERSGPSKFIEQVDQITFSAREALRQDKQIFYITNVGVFKLTDRGLLLLKIMPGIEVQRDIIGACQAKIWLPETGVVPVVDRSIVMGEGFRLRWGKPEVAAAI